MQILRSRDRNIRRIGSLQSPCSIVATEGICIPITLGDVSRSSESVDWEVYEGQRGGSSIHHSLGVSWKASPTMPSPSSFPQTSNRVSEREKHKTRARTFENNNIFWNPGIAKSPRSIFSFKKQLACRARVINEDVDLLMLKSLDRVHSECTTVFLQ